MAGSTFVDPSHGCVSAHYCVLPEEGPKSGAAITTVQHYHSPDTRPMPKSVTAETLERRKMMVYSIEKQRENTEITVCGVASVCLITSS